MRVKTIVDEDFTNYKKPAMFIGTISCGGKCCIEAGIPLSVCQNDGWRASAPISIDDEQLCLRYLNNPLTESIVFGGLEPLEQFDELCSFLEVLRGQFQCKDDVVIYTGYYFEEVPEWIQQLATYGNVIVKFGRYIPNQMIKRTIKETVREYDADGKVVRETVTETTEDDDTMYFPPFQTYQETVKPWWGEPSCTCKTNS